MSQVKICHLTSVHSFDDARIFLKECRTAAMAGFETHLIAPNAPSGTKDGVILHSVPARGRLRRLTEVVWPLYRKARALDAHLYHFHDPELLPVGLLLKLQKKKVIYDVHEDYPQALLEKPWIGKPMRKSVSQLMAEIEKFVSRQVDLAVVVTPHIQKRFVALGCKTAVIHNYPLLNEFDFAGMDWSQKERAICYTGAITAVRGFFEMVAAIGMTDGKLLLAGPFGFPFQKDRAQALPGWQQVEDLGRVSRQKVRGIYGAAMAGLVLYHPAGNHVKALPTKMFEYMGAGIAVICSNFPLWQQIVQESRCGICVDPMNPVEIAQAIRYLLDHPGEARRMGENGRRAIKERYNWETEGKKLINLYETILNRHRD